VMNGIFGAVSGLACVMGPNAVAFLIGRAKERGEGGKRYEAMWWVGLVFYSMQVLVIGVALTAGRRIQGARQARMEKEAEEGEEREDEEKERREEGRDKENKGVLS